MTNHTCCAAFTFASWLAILLVPSFGALELSSLSHSENFDFLASTGTTNNWDDDQGFRSTSGSPGWWWIADNATGYDASDGSSSTPDRTSFGNSADRAMGSLNGGANDYTILALVIQNNTGVDLQDFTISFTGEQWRDGNVATDTVAFSYKTSSSASDFNEISDFFPGTTSQVPATWTGNSNLNFTGTDDVAGDVAVDGNAAANQFDRSDTITVNIPIGGYIALRWHDGNFSSLTDHGLAIDNLSISFTPVPEPAAFLFGGLVCGVIGLGYARRKLLKRGTRA